MFGKLISFSTAGPKLASVCLTDEYFIDGFISNQTIERDRRKRERGKERKKAPKR